MSNFYEFDTLSLHAGQTVDPEFGARAAPIYQTTSYVFPDTDTASSIFNLERGGHAYTRITNPTVGVLEQRIAALEGGSAAVCTSSGMAATFCAITAILGQGDHIVASSQMYGGNISLMKNTLPRFGITATFVDPTDIDGVEKAMQDNTRLIYGELIGNPGLDILDLEAIAAIGEKTPRAVHGGWHFQHALPLPLFRSRSQHHDPLGDEVDGRSRCCDWWGRRGWR